MGVLDPFRFLVIATAGWMHHQQQQAIDYCARRTGSCDEQLGGRRDSVFTDASAVGWLLKAKGLGRRALSQLATIATPETLLASHRKLIARKYDGTATVVPDAAD